MLICFIFLYFYNIFIYITEYVLFKTLTNAVKFIPLNCTTAIRMRLALIPRAHTTVLAILHMSVMVLIVKVSFVFFEAMKFIFCSSG